MWLYLCNIQAVKVTPSPHHKFVMLDVRKGGKIQKMKSQLSENLIFTNKPYHAHSFEMLKNLQKIPLTCPRVLFFLLL